MFYLINLFNIIMKKTEPVHQHISDVFIVMFKYSIIKSWNNSYMREIYYYYLPWAFWFLYGLYMFI